MSPTVVVFGVGYKLESARDICVGGRDPAWERILEIRRWTLLCQPFYPGLHVDRVGGPRLLPPFLHEEVVRICVWRY